jgi:hypothetical protein
MFASKFDHCSDDVSGLVADDDRYASDIMSTLHDDLNVPDYVQKANVFFAYARYDPNMVCPLQIHINVFARFLSVITVLLSFFKLLLWSLLYVVVTYNPVITWAFLLYQLVHWIASIVFTMRSPRSLSLHACTLTFQALT